MSDILSKPFRLGLIVGRFQILHLGHIELIQKSLQICSSVLLFIGSSQESGTEKNPLTYEERKKNLEKIFGKEIKRNQLTIRPLPDAGIGNVSEWGSYVLDQASKELFCPDIAISGTEDRRTSWYDGKSISQLFIQKSFHVSSTDMKKYLKEGDEKEWRRMSPAALWGEYEKLREIVLKTEKRKETESI